MLSEVRVRFDDFITKTFQKEEIRSFLINHERKELVLGNLCEQIVKCERGNIVFNATKYHQVIDDVTKLFCETALECMAQELMSKSERIRIESENLRVQSILSDFDGQITETTTVKEI